MTRWEASSVSLSGFCVNDIFMAKLNHFLPTYWMLILAEDLKPTIN